MINSLLPPLASLLACLIFHSQNVLRQPCIPIFPVFGPGQRKEPINVRSICPF